MRSVLAGIGAVTLISGVAVGWTTARGEATPVTVSTHHVHHAHHVHRVVRRTDPAVSPGFPHGWDVVTNRAPAGPYTAASSNSSSTASHFFREGPGTPPLGEGSLELATGSAGDSRVAAMPPGLAGSELDSVRAVTYDTYLTEVGTHGPMPISFKLGVHSATLGRFTTLVFEPRIQDSPVAGEWQAWNALDGRWWASNVTGECSVSQPCTWSELKAVIGGTSVILIPYFELGASGDAQVDTSCALDRVVINGTTYDLENGQPREAPGGEEHGMHPGEKPGGEPGQGPEVPVTG